jgi:hypothetical protein
MEELKQITEKYDPDYVSEGLASLDSLKRFSLIFFKDVAHPEDGCYQVSHETIYRSLFVQARGVLKKELLCHLRSKRTIRRSKEAGLNSDQHRRLFLRSAKPVAARVEREHQWPAETVLS